MQNQEKQENLGSLEDLSQDEPDRAILAEHPNVHRKSPLIRNRKTGSMEVLFLFFLNTVSSLSVFTSSTVLLKYKLHARKVAKDLLTQA